MLAALPTMALYAHNLDGVMVWELALVLAVSMGVTAVAAILFKPLYANRERVALATSWFVLLSLSYGCTYDINPLLIKWGLPLQLNEFTTLALWAAVVLAGLLWLRRPRSDDVKFTRLANLFAGIVIIMPLLQLGKGLATNPRPPADAAVAEERIMLAAPEQPRDIYYLVFDRYGSQRILEEEFGHNNAPFLDRLRERGFFVADQSHANYPMTQISMSSALNMRYHGEYIQRKTHFLGMLQNHQVGELLQEQGYRYSHLGCLLDGVRWNRGADWNYDFSPMPTEFTDIVFQFTAAYPWFPTKGDRERALEKFDLIESISADVGPKFVYGHFILPHNPWKFDRDGSPVPRTTAAERSDVENYVNQLINTNQRIEQLVDAILANSAPQPIIVIQADEGPELRYEGDEEKDRDTQIRKRSGIISAFYLPERNATEIVPPTISPVNTFRLILREYFGAEISLLDDRFYYWEHPNHLGKPDATKLNRFVEVTDILLSAGSTDESP